MIGKKVKLTKNAAKWYLDNPDIFFNVFGDVSEGYEETIQHSLLTALGEDITGTVIKQGANEKTWAVEFETPFGFHWAYFEYPRSIVLKKV